MRVRQLGAVLSITNMAWHGESLTGLSFKGYTPTQQQLVALCAEPEPQLGTLLTADVSITALPDSQLPASSRVNWALLKECGAEVTDETGTLILKPRVPAGCAPPL
jgi:hypothetical protein